jgi:uracil-DNA glycosylase
MHESWKRLLADEFTKPYFRDLTEFVRKEREQHVVFPPSNQVFEALRLTPYDEAKVLILGQDPYHNAGQAHGLAFSVPKGMEPPPSLQNIYKELAQDIGFRPPFHGCLTYWAEQGVLLLNSVLTVRAHTPGSHRGKGWETFTDAIIRKLDSRKRPLVFVLWGAYARKKAEFINPNRHLIIESSHPSPLSARSGFFGSRPFSQVNAGLKTLGEAPVTWQLPL